MGPRPLPFLPGLPVNRHAMVAPSPRRPLGLRLLNRTGRALRAVGLPVLRLDEAWLFARASRRSGLDDFGDGAFRECLRRLLDALEHEAARTPCRATTPGSRPAMRRDKNPDARRVVAAPLLVEERRVRGVADLPLPADLHVLVGVVGADADVPLLTGVEEEVVEHPGATRGG